MVYPYLDTLIASACYIIHDVQFKVVVVVVLADSVCDTSKSILEPTTGYKHPNFKCKLGYEFTLRLHECHKDALEHHDERSSSKKCRYRHSDHPAFYQYHWQL